MYPRLHPSCLVLSYLFILSSIPTQVNILLLLISNIISSITGSSSTSQRYHHRVTQRRTNHHLPGLHQQLNITTSQPLINSLINSLINNPINSPDRRRAQLMSSRTHNYRLFYPLQSLPVISMSTKPAGDKYVTLVIW